MTEQPPLSVSTSIKEANLHTQINDTTITLIAQPKTVWKIIRAINHWIDNLITFYNDQKDINDEQTWYKQWKGIYKLIKSSKITYIQVYQLMINDYSPTTESTTITQLLEYLINTIPLLSAHSKIDTVPGQEKNQNYMQFKLHLYYKESEDPNNKFNDIRSKNSKYKPFTDNESLCTWHTTPSQRSNFKSIEENSETSSKAIPLVVHTDEIHDNDDKHDIAQSGYTNQSLSPNILSSSEIQPKLTQVQKNKKKSSELKHLVTTACKSEIRNEMTTI